MLYYEFSLVTPFIHNICGKFESPNPEWMHLTRDLLDFELFIVTEGTLYIGTHQKKYVINKGEYLIMSPTPFQHGYQSSNCTFYWMHFSPTTLISDGDRKKNCLMIESDEVISPSDENHIVIPESGEIPVLDRIIVLMKQLQDCDKRYHSFLQNKFVSTSILCEIFNQNAATYRKNNNVNEKSQLYNDITEYISWHICENIKVNEIADYFGYNEKYLSTFFHRMSGTTLKQYILQAKMDHAKAELSDTNRTVSQIAYNIGFSDPHNFTNAFKKITGLTPTEYRIIYSKRHMNFS